MRRASLAVLCLVLPLVFGAAPPASSQPASPPAAANNDVVATIGDRAVTDAELESFLGSKLMRLRQEEYVAKVEGLKAMAFEDFKKAEAVRLGISVEELTKLNVADKVTQPAEAEIDQVLQRYRSQLGPDEAQARQQVVAFLTERGTQARESAWREELLAKAKLRVLLTPPRLAVTIDDDDPFVGPANAPVTIVELTDFHCPYCRRGQDTLAQLQATYGSKLRIVYKQLPLPMHPQAGLAAEASLCAHDQGKYSIARDWLFANPQRLTIDALNAWAATTGLDQKAFADCIQGHAHAKTVAADMEYAASIDVQSTPAYLINGRLIPGAQPIGNFKEIIDEELAVVGK